MINAKLQSIIDTKSAIGNAINNKGGSITVETPFYEYAPAIENISTGGGAYSTFVAQAQDNSLYTVYNGYDSQTNPTPNLSNNFAFNRWLLNNSATGDVVLSNVVVAVGGTFNGTNIVTNQGNIPFVTNISGNYVSSVGHIRINNAFIYAGGGAGNNDVLRKIHESNLVLNSNTALITSGVLSLFIKDDSIYVGTRSPGTIRKYHESNLAFVGATSNYSTAQVQSISVNNSFIFAGGFGDGFSAGNVAKYHAGNLAFVGNTSGTNAQIYSLVTNNGFVFTDGTTTHTVRKYHESNLVFSANTVGYGGLIRGLAINNSYLYVAGHANTVAKYHEGNLAFVGNTPLANNILLAIKIDNGFIYAGGSNNEVEKYNESTLAFVGRTFNVGAGVSAIQTNNSYLYVGGGGTPIRFQQYQQSGTGLEQFSFYNITQIKE
jgi:hypothetical protein